jgi:NAD+ kinase
MEKIGLQVNLRPLHMPKAPSIAFLPAQAPEAQAAAESLARMYGNASPQMADVIVALGGDGHMLRMLHEHGPQGKPIYGMNRGSVGFLMNDYAEEGLAERLEKAETTSIRPLRMRAEDAQGKLHEAIAYNEVSMLRETWQAAKLRISVDGRVRMDELVCDGVLVSTPAGSTAYNLSAHGPILPIDSRLLALTPISAFRPRRWRGAILPHEARVTVAVLEADKRPVSAVADHHEIRNVRQVEVAEDPNMHVSIMFDSGHNLAERVLIEQFKF